MEEMIEQLATFTATYIDGSAIKTVVYENTKWQIQYVGDIEPVTFTDVREMIEFLDSDQFQD